LPSAGSPAFGSSSRTVDHRIPGTVTPYPSKRVCTMRSRSSASIIACRMRSSWNFGFRRFSLIENVGVRAGMIWIFVSGLVFRRFSTSCTVVMIE
jgi:hypothetical protein